MTTPSMHALTLYIGNKNLSSWSLRVWLFLKHLQLPFEEVQWLLDTPDFKSKVTNLGAPPRVPVLKDGALVIWDSLAICEYAIEITGRGLPREHAARAVARSASAEMHSGFQALRQAWPMNVCARNRSTPMSDALAQDIARGQALWASLRSTYGSAGPWLCGEYCLVDAMFAPMVLRFVTYDAVLSPVAQAYVQTTLADPLLQQWQQAAALEVRARENSHAEQLR
ncbi:MAG: glutathione S-transferase family protein [Steroidobacteraceae bacterium]